MLTENLGRLLGLEGCLSGNAPAERRGRPAAAPARAAELAQRKPVQVVYGPGTFINSAVGEIQDRLQGAARRQGGGGARRRRAAARGLARAPGQVRGGAGPAGAARPSSSSTRSSSATCSSSTSSTGSASTRRRGSTTPTSSPRWSSTPTRGATTPKARFAYLFPSSESAAIQVRLKPGLSDARARARDRARARGGGHAASGSCATRGGYTVTGVPVLAEDLADALAGSVARLVVAALLVMALRARARLPPPGAARAAGRGGGRGRAHVRR